MLPRHAEGRYAHQQVVEVVRDPAGDQAEAVEPLLGGAGVLRAGALGVAQRDRVLAPDPVWCQNRIG